MSDIFEIDQESGRPTRMQNIDSEGIMPRTMATDPAGELLVVANQFEVEAFDGDDLRTVPQSLMSYRIAHDGLLTRVGRHELDLGSEPMIWMDVVPIEAQRLIPTRGRRTALRSVLSLLAQLSLIVIVTSEFSAVSMG